VLSARRPALSFAHALFCMRGFEGRPARLKGAGPATSPLRRALRDALFCIAARNAAWGVSGGGTFVPK
jgi:hypothetical protein